MLPLGGGMGVRQNLFRLCPCVGQLDVYKRQNLPCKLKDPHLSRKAPQPENALRELFRGENVPNRAKDRLVLDPGSFLP